MRFSSAPGRGPTKWISTPTCQTHDGGFEYLSDEQVAEFDEGADPCVHVLYLLPQQSIALGATPTAESVAGDGAVFIEFVKVKVKPDPREFARRASRSAGDYRCLVELWTRESNWNHKADNPNSSAYGIAQMLREKSKDPITQVRHGLRYITHRYGDACTALSFHTRHGWY